MTIFVDSVLTVVMGVASIAVVAWQSHRAEQKRKAEDALVALERGAFAWDEVMKAADKVGRKLLTDFRPDYILTFSGSSGIFSNLVLERTIHGVGLTKRRIYTGQVLDRNAGPRTHSVEGMIEIPIDSGDRWRVLIPQDLAFQKPGRIAVIDDTAVTGGTMAAVKRYFKKRGFSPSDVMTGCMVCDDTIKKRLDGPVDFAVHYIAGEYSMPWGPPW